MVQIAISTNLNIRRRGQGHLTNVLKSGTPSYLWNGWS